MLVAYATAKELPPDDVVRAQIAELHAQRLHEDHALMRLSDFAIFRASDWPWEPTHRAGWSRPVRIVNREELTRALLRQPRRAMRSETKTAIRDLVADGVLDILTPPGRARALACAWAFVLTTRGEEEAENAVEVSQIETDERLAALVRLLKRRPDLVAKTHDALVTSGVVVQ